jgi:hypothetical protein
MKKLLFGIIMILLLNQIAVSQVLLKSDKEKIADIDQMRQEIKSNLNSYRKTENINDSNGYRYVFRKDKELKLIMIEYKDKRDQGKYIDKKVVWYFSNGHLIYSEQTWIDIATGELVDNQKFYLDDQYLIAWFKLENGAVESTSKEFIDIAAELVPYGEKLQQGAK